MNPRRALDLTTGWSDATPVDEQDTDPATERADWKICWIRVHAAWQGAIITAWRRTVDGDWAAHAAWGLGEVEHGWIRYSGRTVVPAEPPTN